MSIYPRPGFNYTVNAIFTAPFEGMATALTSLKLAPYRHTGLSLCSKRTKQWPL